MKLAAKLWILFCTGGLVYYWLEIFWRGYSHWSMFFLGAVCFVICGLINEVLSWRIPLPLQMLMGGGIITVLEFVTGCIVNLHFGWQVWDYSNQSFHLLGQICLSASLAWCLISGVAIIVDDFLRYWFMGEERPRYCLWWNRNTCYGENKTKKKRERTL